MSTPAEQRVAREIAPIVEELGRMPSRRELEAMGRSGLMSAIGRTGGIVAWAERLGVGRRGSNGQLGVSGPRRTWTESGALDLLHGLAADFDGRMPTANELRAAGHSALAAKIPYLGGYRAVALKLGLAQKGTETHFGQRWERVAAAFYAAQGAKVERMSTRHPFDLRVNGYRVDVKSARRSLHGFAFAGLKKGEYCDFFHAVCVRTDNTALAHFVIPAEEARIHTLTLSPLTLAGEGKYAQFRDAFGPLLGERSKAA